ncbi:5-hydroxytryptamine receptor 3C, partial [Pteropus alecto]
LERGWLHGEGFLLCLILHLLLQGRGDASTFNCSGFDQHGVDPAAFQAVFDRKAFRPVINFSIPTHVNISFTLSAILEVGDNKECYNDITADSTNVDQKPTGLMAYVNSEGRIRYDKSVQVISICNLDIFYFPFDEQNCTLTFSSFIHTVDNMVLGMQEEMQKILSTSQNLIQSKGEWVLLGVHQRKMKMTVNANQYEQIVFYVAIRHRPRLYVINLLVPSVYFALFLSLMVLSLLETIFITYLLHLATAQPPPMPQ